MSKESGFAHAFYTSRVWRKCAKDYKISRQGLCERCLKKGLIVPGDEVHHKIRLTPENIKKPEISLCWDNMELLCKDCHMEEHTGIRWRADEQGRIEL